MGARCLIVISEPDPVAREVGEIFGTPPSTGHFVDGVPVRELARGTWVVRRPVLHLRDDALDRRLPELGSDVPFVYPSIHRSERGVAAFTVHPLGNLGESAEVGGRPRTLVPSAPGWMTSALRRLSERSGSVGIPACFEATHHGPHLDAPAFFAEVGFGDSEAAPAGAIAALASVLRDLAPDPGDRVALGVGGGHYAPHFTELALSRRWAFGHIVSRHALGSLDAATAAEAYRKTPGAEGILFARAEDAADPRWSSGGPRLRDSGAERRTVTAGRIRR